MSAPVEESTVPVTYDGEWYVATDEATGVASQGRTRPEALANLSEALQLYEEPIPDDVGVTVPDAPWFDSPG